MNYDFLDKLTKNFAKLKEAFASTRKEASETARTINSEFAETTASIKKAGDVLNKQFAAGRGQAAYPLAQAIQSAKKIQQTYDFAMSKAGKGKVEAGTTKRLTQALGEGQWKALRIHAPKLHDDLSGIIEQLTYMEGHEVKATKGLNKMGKEMTKVGAASKETKDEIRGVGTNMSTLSDVSRRLIRRVTALIAAYAGFRAVKGYIGDIVTAGKDLEMLTHRSSLFFGSKGAATDAIDFVKQKIASGKAAIGTVEEMVEGMNSLQGLGIDAKNNFDLLADIAGKAGKSLSDVSSALSSGDWSGFAIPPAYTKFFEMLKGMPAMAINSQLAWLKTQKQFAGGAVEMSNTWEGLVLTLKMQWTTFKEAIVGKESDPNSLASSVKSFLKRITTWLAENKEKIQAYAQGIGEILKWVWKKAEHFLERIASGFTSLSVESIQDKFMRIVVWLEAVTIKIGRFFDKWGSIITSFVKGAFFTLLFNKLASMAGYVLTIGSGLSGLGGGKNKGSGSGIVPVGGGKGSGVGSGVGGIAGTILSFIAGPKIGSWISEKTGWDPTITSIGTTFAMYKVLSKVGVKAGSWIGGLIKKGGAYTLEKAGLGAFSEVSRLKDIPAAMQLTNWSPLLKGATKFLKLAGPVGGAYEMINFMEKIREKGGTTGTGATDWGAGLKSMWRGLEYAEAKRSGIDASKFRPLGSLGATKQLTLAQQEEAMKQLYTAKPLEEEKPLELSTDTITALVDAFGKKMEKALMKNSSYEFSRSLSFTNPRMGLIPVPFNAARNKNEGI